MVTRLGRVPALDGVRGFAILLVIGLHYFRLPGGRYGVDLFFVLSGFLITTLLLEERDRAGRVSLTAFYVRRARRLLPAVGWLLFLIGIITVPADPSGALKVLAEAGLYLANVIEAFAPHSALAHSSLGVLWSLAAEEQFYLVWPLALLVLVRRRRESRVLWYLVSLFVVLAIYRGVLTHTHATWARIYYAPDTHADGLVAGCALALLRRRGLHVPSWLGWAAVAALTPVVLFSSTALGWLTYGLPAIEIACVLVVAAALEPGLFAKVLAQPGLVWVGAISYSLYIWHLVPLVAFRNNAVAALPVAFALAALSYYCIERPFRRSRASRVEPAVAVAS